MRHSRLTYINAYHHVMNRGDKGEHIFQKCTMKHSFLELLREKSRIYRINIYAYAIMENHYHLVLQNTSGRMSDFMRALNGQYANNYRNYAGGKGYVFQNRYRSILVESGHYMRVVIVYVLLNPVRAMYANNPYDYQWSSIHEYFSQKQCNAITDTEFVEQLFGDQDNLNAILNEWMLRDSIPTTMTRRGEVFGAESFISKTMEKYNRRHLEQSSLRMRKNEKGYDTTEKIIKEFQKLHKIQLEDIDFSTKKGKRLRAMLLRSLRDKAGLTYKEIIQFKPFCKLKFSSLPKMYKRIKRKAKKVP